MKTNWQIKKLGEICEVVGGGTPSTSIKQYWDGDLCWVTPKDLGKHNNFEISITERRISQDGLKKSSAKLLPIGSVILSSRAPIGYVVINKVEMATNQGCKSFICSPQVYNKYLYYFLISNTEYLNSLGSGTTFKEVSGSTLKNIEISLPSLCEQYHTVEILDDVLGKVEKSKKNVEKNLKNSRELFESCLQNVFANHKNDWEEKSLEDLGQITSSKRIFKHEYVKEGVPFYRIKEIKELAHNKDITIELYIPRKRYKEIKDIFGVPIIGDILMTAVGTIGEIYVVENDDEFYFKDGNILWFKNFNSVDANFLKYVLMSFVEQINKLAKGSAYSALTIEKIEKHKIYLPKSIVEQKNIVKRLDELSKQIKKLEEIYKKKIEDLEELKKSILSKAFTGGL